MKLWLSLKYTRISKNLLKFEIRSYAAMLNNSTELKQNKKLKGNIEGSVSTCFVKISPNVSFLKVGLHLLELLHM